MSKLDKPKLHFIFTSRNVPKTDAEYVWQQVTHQRGSQKRMTASWIDDASEEVASPSCAATFQGGWDVDQARAYKEVSFWWKRNRNRHGGLTNLLTRCYELGADPNDVIVPWDGDDFMAGPHVFETIAGAYERKPETLMTYGSYRLFPEMVSGLSGQYATTPGSTPIREQPWMCAPPRSFRLKLLNHVPREHLLDPETGRHWDAAWDRGLYLPLMELAGQRLEFIRTPLYLYQHQAPNPTTRGRLGREAAYRAHLMPRLLPVGDDV